MREMFRVWEGVFPAQWCDSVIERVQRVTPIDATIGFDGGQHVDQSYRRSTIRWLDPKGTERDLADKLMSFVERANRDCFGLDLWGMFELQFTEYHGEAGGKYDWHHDVDLLSPNPYDRKLSIVVQLSNPSEYQGGEFEFFNMPQPGDGFKQQGSVLVFPSFYPHRVAPVTAGIRRSMVSWIDGPKWR